MNRLEMLSEEIFAVENQKRVAQIESCLRKHLPENIELQKTVYDAVEYSLMSGGKRLRPMFMKEVYELFDGTENDVITSFMAAIEMIHTYSLVHDDLPAMDDDDYRRGRETTHKVYGEAMGILCGDALLNYAYETALHGAKKSQRPELAMEALLILSKKAGIYGMVGGQVVDVEMTGKKLQKKQIDFIYRLKTSALIEASFMIGAVLAGASMQSVKMLEKIGNCIGMAFQIQDDILDIVSTTEELGKPVHSDEKNEKTTFVTLYGIEAAKKAVEKYSEEALKLLSDISMNQNVFLNTLVHMLIHRKK